MTRSRSNSHGDMPDRPYEARVARNIAAGKAEEIGSYTRVSKLDWYGALDRQGTIVVAVSRRLSRHLA